MYSKAGYSSKVVQVLSANSEAACEQLYTANTQRAEVQAWYWDGYTGCSLLQLGMQRIDDISEDQCLLQCGQTEGCQSVRYIPEMPFCVLSTQLTGPRSVSEADSDLVIGCGDRGETLLTCFALVRQACPGDKL